MRIERIIISLLILSAVSYFTTGAQLIDHPASDLKGRLTGTVMDLNGAVLSGASVTIEGEGLKREIRTNEEGNYEVELPSGVYRITAQIHLFNTFKRAAFRVRPGTTTMINVVPDPVEMHESNTKISYETFQLPQPSDTSLDVVLKFYKKQSQQKTVLYNNATLSHDSLTIYASNIALYKKPLRFIAEGNVIVEDGKQRVYTKRAEVQFKKGTPILTLLK